MDTWNEGDTCCIKPAQFLRDFVKNDALKRGVIDLIMDHEDGLNYCVLLDDGGQTIFMESEIEKPENHIPF